MDALKRPSKFVAVLFTIAAVCSVMTLLLMVVGKHTGTGLILFQVLTVPLLLISAAGNWHTYVQRYVKYEVEQKLKENTGQPGEADS
jgi:hypothetical protein